MLGEINEKAYRKFTQQLDILTSEGDLPVHVELSSEGGFMYDALAIYGRIQTSSVPIYVSGYGKIMSAATIILAGAHYRAVAPESWFFVHDSPETATVKDYKTAKQAEKEEQQWAQILAKHTLLNVKEWRELSHKDTYLTSNEMLQYGIVDKILKKAL